MRADLTNIISEAETPMHGRVITRITALVAVLTLALAAPALAQTSPTADTYAGKQGVLGEFVGGGQDDVVPPAGQPAPDGAPTPDTTPVEQPGNTPTPSVSKGELPFTGLEAGLVALAGLALLGSGFAMRRASRAVA